MQTISKFEGEKTLSVLDREDINRILDGIDRNDFFEITLRDKSDIARADSMGCRIYRKKFQTENICYESFFIRVPKDIVFANALKE